MKNKLVRFDWAIKNLLRQKSNFCILEDFLSQLLKVQIKIKTVLESESNMEHEDDKSNKVDILVETSTSEKIIIEVQCNSEWDYMGRILYGVSKSAIEYIHKGQEYKNIAKIISISVVFFDLGKGQDYIYHGTTEFRGLHTDEILKLGKYEQKIYETNNESVSKIFPEYYIIKVKNFHQSKIKDMLDEWMYFFKNDTIKADFKSPGLKAANEKLNILKLSEKERRAYDKFMEGKMLDASLAESQKITEMVDREEAELKAKEKELKAQEKGKIEGKIEEKIEIAKNLLAMDFDIEIIKNSTGLSIEEIETLKI